MVTHAISDSSLNDTPSGERIHIAFFGLRNAGKSSLVNAVTGQELSVVSDVKGTTTDPVRKAMELLPLGPVLIIDTPGLDDEGTLGELRVKRAMNVLANCDVAVLVHDSTSEFSEAERDLLALFQSRNLPFIIAYNKSDLLNEIPIDNNIYVSALTGHNVNALKEKIASLAKKNVSEKRLVSDLLTKGDIVILVVPIDKAAPKGRLILPQQQTIRDILDSGCSAFICQDNELEHVLDVLIVKPRLVITDSQVFSKVDSIVPKDIMLTSFSILFARYKGDLRTLVDGANKLSHLKDGDKVLISEGCTHHRQCGDIGTEKMPAWIRSFSHSEPEFKFTSGGEFPDSESLREFALIVHCGGCMLNEQEMHSRLERADMAGVPIVNYGVAIAEMHGILRRSLEPFNS
ncbi:MAG: [Synergistaceae bacterium]|nr:[FeFe] hydrogenase H-cluster maturation GTPase HydF [Synergistaceae bacterium]MBR0251329.1 [FeFe] hydrogenase H-cluster maturation GTPase HydF [Synergistaceae bacterium]